METSPSRALASLVRRKRDAAPHEAKLARMAKALLEGAMQGETIGWLQASVAAALSPTGAPGPAPTAAQQPDELKRSVSDARRAGAEPHQPPDEGSSPDTSEGRGGSETTGRRWLRTVAPKPSRPRLPERTLRPLLAEESSDEMAVGAVPSGGPRHAAAADALDPAAPRRPRAAPSPERSRARLPERTVPRLLTGDASEERALGIIHDADVRRTGNTAPPAAHPTPRTRVEHHRPNAMSDDAESMRAIAASRAFRREIEKIIEDTNDRARVAHGYGQ